MSDLTMVQGINNIKSKSRRKGIKEELKMSAISMAMNVGTFKVNLTINKNDKLVNKKNKRRQEIYRIKNAMKLKDEKLTEFCMTNLNRI